MAFKSRPEKLVVCILIPIGTMSISKYAQSSTAKFRCIKKVEVTEKWNELSI